jgi:hypothetical protein
MAVESKWPGNWCHAFDVYKRWQSPGHWCYHIEEIGPMLSACWIDSRPVTRTLLSPCWSDCRPDSQRHSNQHIELILGISVTHTLGSTCQSDYWLVSHRNTADTLLKWLQSFSHWNTGVIMLKLLQTCQSLEHWCYHVDNSLDQSVRRSLVSPCWNDCRPVSLGFWCQYVEATVDLIVTGKMVPLCWSDSRPASHQDICVKILKGL